MDPLKNQPLLLRIQQKEKASALWKTIFCGITGSRMTVGNMIAQ